MPKEKSIFIREKYQKIQIPEASLGLEGLYKAHPDSKITLMRIQLKFQRQPSSLDPTH